jgi:F0F1-type ATP synthase membrane subunit b/b'
MTQLEQANQTLAEIKDYAQKMQRDARSRGVQIAGSVIQGILGKLPGQAHSAK